MKLGARRVAHDAPCFVIAEAGVNHNGNVALAHQLVDAAATAGADAVKFQTFEPDRLASPAARKAPYHIAVTDASETQRDMLRRLSLRPADFRALKAHAEDRALIFLSTPHDEPSADVLDELDVVAFKIASGDVTNHPFLAALARRGRPLLLSTGMSDLAEVAAAVRVIRDAGNPPLALLHCVSSYPAPIGAANLRAMAAMRVAFDVPVGYSDHTLGLETALAAVALGACVLEKHLTLDRSAPGPDHATSVDPPTFHALLEGVRRVEEALGTGVKAPHPCETDVRVAARKSLHFARDVAAGEVIGPADVEARRPGSGIAPARLHEVLGRTIRVARNAGSMVEESDFG